MKILGSLMSQGRQLLDGVLAKVAGTNRDSRPARDPDDAPWLDECHDLEPGIEPAIEPVPDAAPDMTSPPGEAKPVRPVAPAARSVERNGAPRELDYWAKIPGTVTIHRDDALGIYRQKEYFLAKQRRIYGLVHPEQHWRDLEDCSADAEFTDLALSIQLVDGRGALTEPELTNFSTMVLRLAESLDRRFEFAITMEESLDEAYSLNEFRRQFDVLAVLNIVGRSPQSLAGREIDRCVRGLDMEFGEGNRYHKRNPGQCGGRQLFSLGDLAKPGTIDAEILDSLRLDGLTLSMNLPATNRPTDVFLDMAQTAQDLCQQFSADLMDENRKPLDQRGIDRIYREIQRIEADMVEQGVPPGSAIAARLF